MNVARRWAPPFLTSLVLAILVSQGPTAASEPVTLDACDVFNLYDCTEVKSVSITTESTAKEVDGDTSGFTGTAAPQDDARSVRSFTPPPASIQDTASEESDQRQPRTVSTFTEKRSHPEARRTLSEMDDDGTSNDDFTDAPQADARSVRSFTPPPVSIQGAASDEADQRQPRTVSTVTEKKKSQPESDLNLDAATSGFASTEAPQDDARSVHSFTPPPASIQDAASEESDQRQPRYVDTVAAKRGYQPIPNDFAVGKVLNASTGDSLEDKRLRAIRNPVYVDGDKPKEYSDDKAAHGCNCDHDSKPTTTTTTEAPAVTTEPVPASADEDIIDEEEPGYVAWYHVALWFLLLTISYLLMNAGKSLNGSEQLCSYLHNRKFRRKAAIKCELARRDVNALDNWLVVDLLFRRHPRYWRAFAWGFSPEIGRCSDRAFTYSHLNSITKASAIRLNVIHCLTTMTDHSQLIKIPKTLLADYSKTNKDTLLTYRVNTVIDFQEGINNFESTIPTLSVNSFF